MLLNDTFLNVNIATSDYYWIINTFTSAEEAKF